MIPVTATARRCGLACASIAISILFAVDIGRAQAVHPITGRQIAPVMGMRGADWLDREERAREEHPDEALAALDLKPGMAVGDVGAGTGYYSIRIAKRILPGGVVYADDIQAGMLQRLRDFCGSRPVDDDLTIMVLKFVSGRKRTPTVREKLNAYAKLLRLKSV